MKLHFHPLPLQASFAAITLLLSNMAVYSQGVPDTGGIRVAFPEKVPVPDNNSSTPEKIELGKKLFFEPRLSKNNKISCSTCHNVFQDGDDGLPRSPGHEGKLGGRNTPTVWNAAFSSVQFWDGRAPSLEEQAKGPLINPLEMGMASHDVIVNLVPKSPEYVQEFAKVFGPGKVTIDKMVQAIAAFERTLITPNSPYDKFIAGDASALDPSARRGMTLVETVGCTACHNGPMFNGPMLPAGTALYQKFPLIPNAALEEKYHFTEDLGRFLLTKNESDRNMWRVPTWRNVATTAPYFHNGSVEDLEEAVRVMAATQLNKTLPDADVQAIVAFLESLTGERPKITPPILPPPLKVNVGGE